MFCKFCGQRMDDGLNFCPSCGKNQQQIVAKGNCFIPNNSAALWAYYLGLAVLACGFTSIPALIMGIKGLQYEKIHPEAHGGVHSWVGIIMGAIGIVFLLAVIVCCILSITL